MLSIYRKEIPSALFIVLKQFKMAENILDIFLSDSDSDEFEGFIEADIEAVERRSIGSDISLSDFEDSSSEEESEEERDDATWSRQLHKPNVTEFTEEVCAGRGQERIGFFLEILFYNLD